MLPYISPEDRNIFVNRTIIFTGKPALAILLGLTESLPTLQSTYDVQELEDAALKVLEDQAKIKALLEEKSAELAVIKEEYETKKKEVKSATLH